jgi:hypothetical protein
VKLLSAAERLAEPRGPKILIVGVPGAGKTRLLASLSRETLAQTLFIDAEAGDIGVRDLDVASARPVKWEDCQNIAVAVGGPNIALPAKAPYSQAHYATAMADPLLASLAEFSVLFIDSLSEIGRQCLTHCLQQPEGYTERGKRDLRAVYGLVARELIGFLQQVQHDRPRTVVMTAILEKSANDYGPPEWRPQLPGQRTGRELFGIIDEIITMHSIDFGDGKPLRCFVTSSPNAWSLPGKDRSGKLSQLEEPNIEKLLLKLNTSKGD